MKALIVIGCVGGYLLMSGLAARLIAWFEGDDMDITFAGLGLFWPILIPMSIVWIIAGGLKRD